MQEILLKNVKKNDFFTLKFIEEPKESQVLIKGDYNRSDKKFECTKFNDVNDTRFLKGDKKVYIGFTF